VALCGPPLLKFDFFGGWLMSRINLFRIENLDFGSPARDGLRRRNMVQKLKNRCILFLSLVF
jgi:hypothetical protein